MSVDRTIEELSGTLNQLGILVEHINTQIVGITSRINLTLDNFDSSVAGIASDAGAMTGQVGDTIAQVPNAWVFYLLFITLIIVLILLSVLIIISLATRLHAIYHIIRGDRHTTLIDSPYPSNYDSKQPLTLPISPLSETKRRHHVTVPMESEPRRYGENVSYSQPQDPGGYNPFFGKHNIPPPPRNTESANEAYLRRPLNPHAVSAVQIDPPVPTPTPRYTKKPQYRGEPV
ncbi:unnamed protein product [Bursaphelenchus xylophilus]|uniref:(pine wood nematode) hypothetical protein n=1 Tax=Bursaphelenchus xylophilus TaxID=6326 RepID=A0A7I8XQ22_BURXY|nr:unnamed protein product [Bursaphelenchus xylophilus]CAG9126941.1 unnamed protein product [Bursaphelenchus xylophilus]